MLNFYTQKGVTPLSPWGSWVQPGGNLYESWPKNQLSTQGLGFMWIPLNSDTTNEKEGIPDKWKLGFYYFCHLGAPNVSQITCNFDIEVLVPANIVSKDSL